MIINLQSTYIYVVYRIVFLNFLLQNTNCNISIMAALFVFSFVFIASFFVHNFFCVLNDKLKEVL